MAQHLPAIGNDERVEMELAGGALLMADERFYNRMERQAEAGKRLKV
jgi:hypothetical protein